MESQELGLPAHPVTCQGEQQVGPCSKSPGGKKDYLPGMLLELEVLGSFSLEERGFRGTKDTVQICLKSESQEEKLDLLPLACRN